MIDYATLTDGELDRLALAGSEPAIVELETRAFDAGYKLGQQDARAGVCL